MLFRCMRKAVLALLSLLILLSSCERKAEIPVYLRIDDFKVQTDFASQGTASHRITTVWIQVNGDDIGAYELPAVAPIIADGQTEIRVIPGINLNGQLSLRNQYEFYKVHTQTINATAGSEVLIKSGNNPYPVTTYTDITEVVILEDFEGAGINFQSTAKSDTALLTTTDPNEVFTEPGLNETNLKSGKVTLPKGPSLVEFESINRYVLPKFGNNVYLEVNYKCEVPITFGIFAHEPGQSIQAPVVAVVPTDGEWRKVYINLVSEVSAYPNATNYSIFFGTTNKDSQNKKLFYVDNMKLVYWP